MYIIKLKITSPSASLPDIFHYVGYYLRLLYKNTQIINNELQYEATENGVMLNLYCPEKDSYKDKNASYYAINAKNNFPTELELNLTFELVGLDPELGKTFIPKKSTHYILTEPLDGNWSPLICGDTYNQIPLYKIPFTYEGKSHQEINYWEYNYRSIKTLWHIGYGQDRWTLNQLQNYKSELNQKGVSCCRQIEKVTNIPTYYFLFNDRAWGKTKDKSRKCPGCGKDWFIPDSTNNNLVAFKCDDCRLVSQLSSRY
ncbi:DUF2310 family Zn-ribbon-containing protein [Adhaeribacter rhizoryzae]|uniref:Uncharacterized protein n=1 Tax=Adhaeribacter rhizoryzae TaxID=2607907 RepID=A0A5M6DA37_9BACT|nr:DUF2310 family Zn-ribbon-containing protein [Adhaeribacter rhizoryzae]KAA5542829.1 hypothetical protein F0145_17980 [Adhaeribacter rhizoryzae]